MPRKLLIFIMNYQQPQTASGGLIMSIDKIKNQFKQKKQSTSLNQFGSLLSDNEIFALYDLLDHRWRTSPLSGSPMASLKSNNKSPMNLTIK